MYFFPYTLIPTTRRLVLTNTQTHTHALKHSNSRFSHLKFTYKHINSQLTIQPSFHYREQSLFNRRQHAEYQSPSIALTVSALAKQLNRYPKSQIMMLRGGLHVFGGHVVNTHSTNWHTDTHTPTHMHAHTHKQTTHCNWAL